MNCDNHMHMGVGSTNEAQLTGAMAWDPTGVGMLASGTLSM